MIREDKIISDGGNGVYTIFYSPDFAFANPIEHFMEMSIRRRVSMMRDIISLENPPIPKIFIEKYIHKIAFKEWFEELQQIQSTHVPDNLIAVLGSESKSEQVKLLKGVAITPEELRAFIIRAWSDFGYSYSQYMSQHHHNGVTQSELPKLIEVKDGKVNKVGKTELTDGQLKQAVENRKVIVSKFIGNTETWHCLFITYDSLKGKELWKNGQPHYHYISDKFGFTREQVVTQLKSKKYSLGNLPHIDLLGYDDSEDE